jgi:hypothetical protein
MSANRTKNRIPKPAGSHRRARRLSQLPRMERLLRPKADHGEESYRGSGRLEGLSALITGADSGIGRCGSDRLRDRFGDQPMMEAAKPVSNRSRSNLSYCDWWLSG